MEALVLAQHTATPIQVLGMSFYFDRGTVERAKELGLNVYEFYGLGRGGVLGDVDTEVIQSAFTFFDPATIHLLWEKPRGKASPVETAETHLQSAYDFADRTFGALPHHVLADFAEASHRVASHVAPGHHLLFDGYRRFDVPESAVHSAYLATILLRELRGCAHIDAVNTVELTPSEAAFLQDAGVFTLHGYAEADAPHVTPELEAKKLRAEALTDEAMAGYFSVLSDEQRRQLADGADALFGALSAPVAVSD